MAGGGPCPISAGEPNMGRCRHCARYPDRLAVIDAFGSQVPFDEVSGWIVAPCGDQGSIDPPFP